MFHAVRLHLLDSAESEKLVLAVLEEGIPFAFVHFLELKDVLVKGNRLLDIVHLERNMIDAVNLHAHISKHPTLVRACKRKPQCALETKRPLCDLGSDGALQMANLRRSLRKKQRLVSKCWAAHLFSSDRERIANEQSKLYRSHDSA